MALYPISDGKAHCARAALGMRPACVACRRRSFRARPIATDPLGSGVARVSEAPLRPTAGYVLAAPLDRRPDHVEQLDS
jgi:hypothetical protein